MQHLEPWADKKLEELDGGKRAFCVTCIEEFELYPKLVGKFLDD
jgi:hypothetical protein